MNWQKKRNAEEARNQRKSKRTKKTSEEERSERNKKKKALAMRCDSAASVDCSSLSAEFNSADFANLPPTQKLNFILAHHTRYTHTHMYIYICEYFVHIFEYIFKGVSHTDFGLSCATLLTKLYKKNPPELLI